MKRNRRRVLLVIIALVMTMVVTGAPSSIAASNEHDAARSDRLLEQISQTRAVPVDRLESVDETVWEFTHTGKTVFAVKAMDRATEAWYLQRAFELGADDYMSKREELLRIDQGMGISPPDFLEQKGDVDELLGRVRARLRITPPNHGQQQWQSVGDNVRVDFDGFQVESGGQGNWRDTRLTPTELAIFRILVERSGRPVGRNQIIDFVERERGAEDQDEMTGRSLESHISRLRKKLAEAGGGGNLIDAVQGIGYRLVTSN